MNPTLTSQESFTLSDSVYQMRMSDFCHNYMSTASSWTETKLERAVSPVMSNLEPICANESFINVSQINNNSPYINKICSFGLFPLNHHDSGMSSFSQTFNEIPNSSSPSYPTRTKPLINKNLLHVTGSSGRFQSTPNKSFYLIDGQLFCHRLGWLVNNDNEDEWAEAQLAGRSLQVIQVHGFNIELTVFT